MEILWFWQLQFVDQIGRQKGEFLYDVLVNLIIWFILFKFKITLWWDSFGRLHKIFEFEFLMCWLHKKWVAMLFLGWVGPSFVSLVIYKKRSHPSNIIINWSHTWLWNSKVVNNHLKIIYKGENYCFGVQFCSLFQLVIHHLFLQYASIW